MFSFVCMYFDDINDDCVRCVAVTTPPSKSAKARAHEECRQKEEEVWTDDMRCDDTTGSRTHLYTYAYAYNNSFFAFFLLLPVVVQRERERENK